MNNNDNCSICLENIDNELILPCNHSFCKVCILTWLNDKCNCPLCRAEVIAEDILINNDLMTDEKWERTERGFELMIFRMKMDMDIMTEERFEIYNKMISDYNRIKQKWELKKEEKLEQIRILEEIKRQMKEKIEREIREMEKMREKRRREHIKYKRNELRNKRRSDLYAFGDKFENSGAVVNGVGKFIGRGLFKCVDFMNRIKI